MIKCELCKSSDFSIATVKKNNKRIIICNECESVYEVNEKGLPVLGHDPKDIDYFEELNNLFKNWDELEDVILYKQ